MKMLNFTVGPVQMREEIREIGAEQIPYFRTKEFSEIMMKNEFLIKKFAKASESARAVFITGSGTAAMESVVMNSSAKDDKVLIINGGSFGQRFVEICKIHKIPYTEVKLEMGKQLCVEQLERYENCGYTGLLVNVHETSTGVLYDIEMIGRFCKKNGIVLVADVISAFLADFIDMEKMGIDALIIGAQKAMACPPGISILILSKRITQKIEKQSTKCLYLDLKNALKNGERGQTPFTPAVGILLQIHERLKQIEDDGGVEKEREKIHKIATDFRNRIKDMPFEIISESLSNAVTPLHPTRQSAYEIFQVLKDEYNIWVCPNGGDMKDKVFRVGHIGELTVEDNKKLVEAMKDMQKRGIL